MGPPLLCSRSFYPASSTSQIPDSLTLFVFESGLQYQVELSICSENEV